MSYSLSYEVLKEPVAVLSDSSGGMEYFLIQHLLFVD